MITAMPRAVPRFLPFLLLLCLPVFAQERCGVARDLMLRALERIRANTTNAETEDSLQLLKLACEQCAGLGDAWYFRSLFERKLGRARQADYALGKAKLVGSEALNLGLNPFRLAAPPLPGEKFTAVAHDKWALVVGCKRFQDRRIKSLRYTTADAEGFAAVLQDPAIGKFKPGHVQLLTDENATTVRIRTELNKLARTAAAGDLVAIFIASHGSAREQDTAGVNYILTYDTNVADQDSLYATALPMWEVVDVVRSRMQARKAAVFLDTCHAAGAFHSGPLVALGLNTAPSAATLETAREGVGRAIVSSSQVGESSWESDKIAHGYFTYFLMQALRQSRGLDSIGKIYGYLREQVPRRVMADQQADQTPVMTQSERGADLIVGVMPELALYLHPAVVSQLRELKAFLKAD